MRTEAPRAQEPAILATAHIQPAAPDNLVALAADWGAADPALAATLRESQSPIMALTRYGLARYAAGDFKQAAEMFKAVAEAAADQPLAWNNLALALIALDRHEPAVAGLNRSLALEPAQPAIWTSLAGALLQLDRTEEAEAACTQAIALDSRSAAPWQLRALSRAKREDFAGAAAAFARTIEIAGANATLQSEFGDDAVQNAAASRTPPAALQRAIGLDPAAAEIHGMARMAQFMIAVLADDIDGATALYQEEIAAEAFLEVDTTFKTALLYLDRFGHRAAAAKVAGAWVESRPGNAEAKHLRDAALGQGADRVPASLVAEQFDAYADGFDDQPVAPVWLRRAGSDRGLAGASYSAWSGTRRFSISAAAPACARRFCGLMQSIWRGSIWLRAWSKKRVCAASMTRWKPASCWARWNATMAAGDLIVAADVLAYFGEDLRGGVRGNGAGAKARRIFCLHH